MIPFLFAAAVAASASAAPIRLVLVEEEPTRTTLQMAQPLERVMREAGKDAALLGVENVPVHYGGSDYQFRLPPGPGAPDTSTLATLPAREFTAGLAEVAKYGAIRDLPFFEWIETHADELVRRDPDALAYAIRRSCEIKAEIVAQDERESGVRALLNFGHTFGHAIEAGLGYGTWLHGEAVAAGTVLAARLSARLGWLSEGDVERIVKLFIAAGLPTHSPEFGADRYLELMSRDKKVASGKLRLILLRALGEGVVTSEAPLDDIRAVLP